MIVIQTEQFEETKNIVGGTAYPAHKYGRVLYEAARPGPTRPYSAWVAKAAQDIEAALFLLTERGRFRGAIGFHS